jgi:hypothetical protein
VPSLAIQIEILRILTWAASARPEWGPFIPAGSPVVSRVSYRFGFRVGVALDMQVFSTGGGRGVLVADIRIGIIGI